MQVQVLFDSWTLSRSPLPPRSLLYALEPIGVGTAFVESLNSYVARLAEAHSVSVGDLVGLVLSDVPNLKGALLPPAAKAGRRGGHGFRVCSYTVNGVTDRAITWAHALEVATSRHDLQYLTLLPFRRALPDHLFHRHRAWCSLCYEQWRLNSQTVYEPLLWAIKTSSHCLIHQRPLRHDCPHCGRLLNPLGVFARSGHCERCGGWLGVSHAGRDQSSPVEENQTWTCTQIGGLLELLPLIDAVAARETFRRNLNVYLDELARGNVLAFAEYVGCPHSMLHTWLTGAAVPRLDNLLRIARSLNVPISSLYAPLGPTSTNIAAAKQAVAVGEKRVVSPSRHASEIRRVLLAALDEDVPLRVTEIARKLGYTTTYSLYAADRKLCYKITARYRRLGGGRRWNRSGAPNVCEVHAKQGRLESMRRLLENALHQDPPPTLTDLSRHLGYSHSAILRRHEPTLCDQLMARHRASVAKRKADLEKEATVALGETPVPSLRAICRRLGITVPFMNKHFHAVARMIVERHRQCLSAETANRRELLLRQIPDIAAALDSRGLYPSVPRIVERLPERSRRDWKTITSAAREARNALARESSNPSTGTPRVLRQEEVHVIANTVAKGMADLPHTV
jgi:AraC-like DNA-binding protein